MFSPARLLDPLRIVHGTRHVRYDCPDLATLDGHLDRLRRRVAALDPADGVDCRADIDRLLDRRRWLTLPVTTALTRAASPPPPGPRRTPRS